MIPELEFNKTFEKIKKATNDPEQILVTHMWEKKCDIEDIETRLGEVDNLLEVTAGNTDAVYNDAGYVGEIFFSRNQRGTKDGMIGLATSPIYSKKDAELFNMHSSSGPLLLNPTSVFVSPHDAFSTYYDDENVMPSEKAWKEGALMHTFYRDNPQERSKLIGTVSVVLDDYWDKFFNEIVKMQLPDNLKDSEPKYLNLDPLSSQVHENAGKAYKKLLNTLKANRCAEVAVNAKLEQSIGIVAQNAKTTYVDPLSWKNTFNNDLKLARSVYFACIEHEVLTAKFKKYNIAHTPTIVIYQQHAREEDRLIHFPPTKKNKDIVLKVLRERGIIKSKDSWVME